MSIEHVGTGLRPWAVVCGLLFWGFFLTGCRSASSKQDFADLSSGAATASFSGTNPVAAVSLPATTPAPEPAKAPAKTRVSKPVAPAPLTKSADPEPQVFRVGDSMTVSFTDTPMVIQPFEEKIKEDGTITLALNMTFKAVGKTQGELEKEIRARYVPDYYKYMTVTVTPRTDTRWYYVNGEVKQNGRLIYTSRITVLKAIASAGGFTDFANKKKVQLIRLDGRTMSVNCIKALENPALDLEVYPGDTIHVRRRFW